jgi:hypothetical protein
MRCRFQIVFMHFKHQFIVYLHDHTHPRPIFFKPCVDSDHRPFDDIRSGTLHRGIDSSTLRTRTTRRFRTSGGGVTLGFRAFMSRALKGSASL